MLALILRDFTLPLLYSILRVGLTSVGIAIAIYAFFYHSIFKPDYRPGGKSMPFVWLQMVRSIYNQSRNSLVMNKICMAQSLSGMCKLMEHQKIFSFSICGKVYVFLFTPESAEILLSSSTLIEKSSDYDNLKLLFGTGLFISKGDLWRSRRKLLTPTFHFKILRDFTPLMQETSKSFVNNCLNFVNEPWVEINHVVRMCGYNMIIKTALGLDPEIDDDAISAFKASIEFDVINSALMTRPWLYSDFILNLTSFAKKRKECVKIMHNLVRKVLEKKKRLLASREKIAKTENNIALRKNGRVLNGSVSKCNESADEEESNVYKKSKIFIDMLLDLHYKDPTFTEDDILYESVVFIGASIGTMGSNISCLLYSIGLHKDVQKKIQDELDHIFQGSDRDVMEDDLKLMKYMDCVIKESLRLYSATFLSRLATESFKVFDYTVPKGSTVVLFTQMIHKDPKAFPNPEVFDPSRFFPENSVGRHPYAYIPFSAGPRNCIGKKFSYMTMKTIVAALLRTFDIESMDERDKFYAIPESDNIIEVPVRIKFSLRKRN